MCVHEVKNMKINIKILVALFLKLSLATSASSHDLSALPPEPPQDATRSELNDYAITILKRTDGGSEIIYDGEFVKAIFAAFQHISDISSPDDQVRHLPSRLIAVTPTEKTIDVSFFSKLYPSSEVVGEIYPGGICPGYCFRFGPGTTYVVSVDRESLEIISTRIIPD